MAGRQWMTSEETVEYLGLPSRGSLYTAVRRGQVPGHRLGRRLRFRREEIDQVLEKRKTCVDSLHMD
jgi:excisionase family DNA binding protein